MANTYCSAMIAAAVYLLGGIAYQRTVMHQRGWKQLPNYSTWAGIGNFLYVSDLTDTLCRQWPNYPICNLYSHIRSEKFVLASKRNRALYFRYTNF